MVPVSFGTTQLLLRSDRAVYWPRERTLFVADLHLEKASFFASHGQPLPPYDSRATLEAVTQAVRETGAERVVTLGDNFHDAEGASRLEETACEMLRALTRTVDWVWITGNHDGPSDADEAANRCGGTLHAELEIGGIVCRHEALPGESRPELSGHWHPKLDVTVRGRRVRRPCAVMAQSDAGPRMVLPAFGTLTGGMDAGDPAIRRALGPAESVEALCAVRDKLVRIPLWRSERCAA
ncbi:ligase-associated DNA damage response endonuclease PdeM [Citromicrobium bathyomarinum]|uniref:ligase-associated DNA damage response endonuclease PdeM n=1 Tax=Citromicrobium bathyomarinum TaxID=72174 RepID=UPI00315ABA56